MDLVKSFTCCYKATACWVDSCLVSHAQVLFCGGWLVPCACALPSIPVFVCFLVFVVLPLCFLCVAFFPSSALPSPSLRCADPMSCGGAAPFRGVLRVPNCAVSSAALVRSAWLPLHLCPLSRPEWLVFCATCCRQRYWARYMRHGTKDFGPVWEFCPFTPCGLPLSLPLSS